MATDVVRQRTQTAIDLEFAERDAPLAKQRQEVSAEFARHGASTGGRHALAIAELYNNEVKIRGALILQAYMRVMAVSPVEPGHGPVAEAVNFLVPLLERTAKELQESMLSLPNFKSSGHLGGITLDEALQQARKRLIHEAELMEAAMAAAPPERHGPQINITGNQNIIQAGSRGAVATIVLDANSRTALIDALKGVRDALGGLSEASMPARKETTELVQEAEDELAKSEPNKIRLASILKGIAETVRTVAALRPAYESLKGALAWIGIHI